MEVALWWLWWKWLKRNVGKGVILSGSGKKTLVVVGLV